MKVSEEAIKAIAELTCDEAEQCAKGIRLALAKQRALVLAALRREASLAPVDGILSRNLSRIADRLERVSDG